MGTLRPKLYLILKYAASHSPRRKDKTPSALSIASRRLANLA